MTKKISRLASLTLLEIAVGAVAGPALAADMPTKAPPPIAAPVYNWTGFYVGVNAGFGWGRKNADLTGDGQNNAGNDLISRVFDGPLNFNQLASNGPRPTISRSNSNIFTLHFPIRRSS